MEHRDWVPCDKARIHGQDHVQEIPNPDVPVHVLDAALQRMGNRQRRIEQDTVWQPGGSATDIGEAVYDQVLSGIR